MLRIKSRLSVFIASHGSGVGVRARREAGGYEELLIESSGTSVGGWGSIKVEAEAVPIGDYRWVPLGNEWDGSG